MREFVLFWVLAQGAVFAQPLSLDVLLDRQRADPSNPNLCQQVGIAYMRLQQFDKAEPYFRKAIHLNPKFWAAHKNLATVLWFEDRKPESEREFQAVTNVLPEDPVPHLYLGLAAHARHNFASAKIHFEKAGDLARENPEVQPVVFETYLETGDLENARGILERKPSAEGWRMLAEAYDRFKKPEDAYRAFSQAIEADPNSEDNYVALAEFSSGHGNGEFALQAVARGLEKRPQSATLIFERGLLFAEQGDRKQAEASFQEAGRMKPDWALPEMALGVSKLESGDAAQAAVEFQKARTIDPNDYRAHFLYATALSRGNRNRQEAMEALHRAIQLNPQDARSLVLLGQLDAEHAEANWRVALKIDPENQTALYQLGLLCQKQGKAAEAKSLLERFRVAKEKQHGAEESLVPILRITHLPAAANPSNTRAR